MLRLAIDTHLITSHYALALLIRRPGGLVVEMTDGTREYNADALPAVDVLRPGEVVRHPARVRAGRGARAARLHRRGADAGLDALRDDARELLGHRSHLARGDGREPALRRHLRIAPLRGPRRRRARRRPGPQAPQRRLVLLRRPRARVRLHRSRRLPARLLALPRRGPGRGPARRTRPATADDVPTGHRVFHHPAVPPVGYGRHEERWAIVQRTTRPSPARQGSASSDARTPPRCSAATRSKPRSRSARRWRPS